MERMKGGREKDKGMEWKRRKEKKEGTVRPGMDW